MPAYALSCSVQHAQAQSQPGVLFLLNSCVEQVFVGSMCAEFELLGKRSGNRQACCNVRLQGCCASLFNFTFMPAGGTGTWPACGWQQAM